ncbi:MAG: patatin-like phospholipase family protein [Gammaproteobacteria bacterium]
MHEDNGPFVGGESMDPRVDTPKAKVALVLQGGGALGAYQLGVYRAMEERGCLPEWIAGTSIGAINGAIIAGNPPGTRVSRLEEFWRQISTADFCDLTQAPDVVCEANSLLSAAQTILAGRPGFFSPSMLPWSFGLLPGSCERASFYDTAELRFTLLRLVDFDEINAGQICLTLDAVRVRSGELVRFDSALHRIGPEHIMASAALPPGFPGIRIDGELYWDGGVFSNTPLDALLDGSAQTDILCFIVDLWNTQGPEPRTIAEVQTRQKDILYASVVSLK